LAKDHFPNDKATNEWLDSLKKSTRATYQTYWRYFLEFTSLTGNQIIDSRKTDREYAWEKKVIEFKRWIIEEKKQSEHTATTAAATVRGFFSYHRLPLSFRRQESAQLKEAEAKYEDYRFTREELKKICEFADLEEKYVVTAGKSFGLRAGDFLRLMRGDLEPYLDRPVPISLGEYRTQKEGVKAFPFIDSDAQPVIKLMMDQMNRKGRTQPTDRMLTYTDEIQLSRILRRLTAKAGINIGNRRVRFHCLRKFLIDRLASHMSESKWKQIVGKKISESAYVSPDSLREDYARAMPDTCFTTAPEGDISKLAKYEALKALADTMGIKEEITVGGRRILSREAFKRAMSGEKPLSIEDKIAKLEKLIREKQKERTETNGGDCGEEFMQIPETEFLSYLREGWTLMHKLDNGEVIVRR